MSAIRLAAPWAGWAMPLADVPDPAFAQGMMGEGIAIDPLEGTLRAPCAGVVGTVAATGHAVTLLLENGAELLLHVGVDTVALQGKGFRALVERGASVDQGTPLIEVDLASVAAKVKSLRTPVLIANSGYRCTVLACDRLVEPGDPIMDVTPLDLATQERLHEGEEIMRAVELPPGHGLHARPAARIGAALKGYGAQVRIEAHGRSADARSTTGLMALGTRAGDRLHMTAVGADAAAALAALAALIETGLEGETETPAAPVPAATLAHEPLSANQLRGVRAAPGMAIGSVFKLVSQAIAVERDGRGTDREMAALTAALSNLSAELGRPASTAAEEIMAAHRAMLYDPELLALARSAIAKGRSAGWAWREATRARAGSLQATGDARLVERVADLRDLEQRILARLSGDIEPGAPSAPAGSIVIADDLLPSRFLELQKIGVAGIATARGGATAHAAILAAAAGVPMIVAVGPAVLELANGDMAVLDADRAIIDCKPDKAAIADARALQARRSSDRAAALESAHTLCRTRDGERIEIFANLGSAADARSAVAAGAEGCGLLRTEFLFLDRQTAPDEAEQRAAYAAIANALEDRPLIVRTLDVGADKQAPYLPAAFEDNPALGLRGVRLSLARPELLKTQLRAILTGVPAPRCRIMVPMVVDPSELLRVREMLDMCQHDLGLERVPLGVMIETPAAALMAAEIAVHADFLSVGTNDLTQYTLCIDRTSDALAARADALHPAVIRLIAAAGTGAARHDRPLGVCGALASDPLAAPLLLGLGVTELSAIPAMIPALKARVRALEMAECRTLAERALSLGSPAEIRALLEKTI
ncbi:phosphoenolpyruvate--protein phosphotransferase [Novosphingopyxis sp.]|uniref:phosphoenolpyruvate--protein phosphotransferase n=1 Tax=Novosphingopyxis sp. TaxID=2709690 RepID=UPI003B5C9A4E